MEYPDELDFEYEAFSPAAQRYLATPSRFEGEVGRPTQRTSLGDDFQTYTPIGESGSSWGGRTTTYQVYDAYGNPTEVIDVAQSGGIKDALQTAAQVFGPTLLSGGLGSLISPYVGQAASAVSDILGGGTVGGIGSAATTGALNSAVGAALSGNSLQDALLTGAIGGAASPLASSIVEPLNLPEPITNIATRGLTAELVGKDAEKAMINAAVGELLSGLRTDPNEAALRAAYGPEGQASRMMDVLPTPEPAPEPEFIPPFDRSMLGTPTFDVPVTSPREQAAFLEANIPEPAVVEQMLREQYPDIFSILGPAEDVGATDWAALHAEPSVVPGYTDPDGYYVHETAIVPEPQENYPVQDFGAGAITPESLRGMDEGYQRAVDNGGFTSQWQTVGSDRVMVMDDGSAIGLNTETGETYGLEAPQTQRLIDAGLLNTEQSGYAEAIGAAPAPPPAPAAPPAAPAAPPPPAPTASRGLDIGALTAIMGAMGAGQRDDRDEYQLADVAPGVKSGLEAIEQMFGRG